MLPHMSNQEEYKALLEREEAKLSRTEKDILARRKYSKAKDKMLLMDQNVLMIYLRAAIPTQEDLLTIQS